SITAGATDAGAIVSGATDAGAITSRAANPRSIAAGTALAGAIAPTARRSGATDARPVTTANSAHAWTTAALTGKGPGTRHVARSGGPSHPSRTRTVPLHPASPHGGPILWHRRPR